MRGMMLNDWIIQNYVPSVAKRSYKGRIDVGPNSISAEFKLTIRSNNGQGKCN